MRSSKRVLAGVAAGALTLGALTLASAPAASAAGKLKPKATATAVVTPVRATGTTAPTLDIPPALMGWRNTGAMSGATLTLTTAPTAGAKLTSGGSDASLGSTITVSPSVVGDDTGIQVNVDTPGYYAGTVVGGGDAVSFSFTTAGTPTTLEITPASQTVLVGADASVMVKLKDASGRLTQPQVLDTVVMSSSGDDTIADLVLDGTDLALGMAQDDISTQSAGTSTITATPAGTLPGTGVVAATATLIKSGTVSSVAVKSIRVTAPANAYSTSPATDLTPDFNVPVGTRTVTFTIDDTTTAAPGNTIGIAYYTSLGTINGESPVDYHYTTVTTNAEKRATYTVVLAGDALLSTNDFGLWQVDVLQHDVAPPGDSWIGAWVYQTVPTVTASTTTVSPTGPMIKALGTSTTVDVTVADDFGNVYSGVNVAAYRGSVSNSNLLSQATTNASGVARVTVTNATGATSPTSESYVYQVTPAAGSPFTAADGTDITYTTDGDITSMDVAVGVSGATTPITDTTTDIAVLPYQFVPFTGAANTPTTGTFTVSGGAGVPTGDLTEFTPTTVPANTVTVTVPFGVRVSTTGGPVAWNGGAQSVTVNSGDPVYVLGWVTGEHTVTFTSGGKTATAKIKVATAPIASYNISISPLTQRIDRGGFGTATVSVTDPFGNLVPGSDSGMFSNNTLTVTASGAVLLAGYSATQTVKVDANGHGTVTIIAGYADGEGTLAVTPSADADVLAWDPSFTPPEGAPAPTTSAAASVVVGSAVDKALVISGTRGTVSGKSGILVDGTSTGFDAGAVTVPFVKFPGQTTYTPGTARPVIDSLGDFSWKRKTGKKAYVVFTDELGTVRSNRIIIPAA